MHFEPNPSGEFIVLKELAYISNTKKVFIFNYLRASVLISDRYKAKDLMPHDAHLPQYNKIALLEKYRTVWAH
jgi:hypothetical protein